MIKWLRRHSGARASANPESCAAHNFGIPGSMLRIAPE
jgi:hypothetical protein